MALTKVGKEGIANISNSSDATVITIDSSENVMVGKTSTNFQTVGVEAKTNGSLHATADQNNPIVAVRKTNDGKIQAFYKDTTEVGYIGNAGARLFINSGNVGLNFAGDGSNQILPSNAGANRDDAIILGTTNVRFKDLYLSGGVFLGGTDAAHQLDDYEEGSYDVTITCGASGSITLNSSFNTAAYTKIGRMVHVQGLISASSVSSPVGFIGLSLPFTPANLSERIADSVVPVYVTGVASANVADFVGTINENDARIFIQLGDATSAQNDAAQQIQASTNIMFSATYITS
jgi:hypothetical protein